MPASRRFSAARRNWEGFSRTDPMWAILTAPGSRGAWDREEFLSTGEHDVAALLEQARGLGLAPRPGAALDFGCGLGRLTLALGGRFERVVGVDVARGMIDQARELATGRDNVRYVHNDRPDLAAFADGSFDFICSLITLQHVPTGAALAYVGEFARLLAPGGVAVFQAPSRRLGSPLIRALARLPQALVSLRWRLANRTPYYMEMNALPREAVQRAVAQAGAAVLHAVPDTGAGPGWESLRYFVSRAGA